MNKLKISPEARNDLVEVKNYISQELYNPEAAVKFDRKNNEKDSQPGGLS
ncbi:hypothetical protein [Paenibacillus oralis]|nr:hypothetical protein [Paenibacillus oralis]